MRTVLIIKFLSSLIFTSWEKTDDPFYLDNGNYSGTFERELVWGKSDNAKITMTFSSDTWSGSGDHIKYPALCNGTYRIEEDTIVFEINCVWTAEFYASLILSGKYKLVKNEYSMEFNRDYRSANADTYADRYKLTKQIVNNSSDKRF
jgi:hypothetical protein